jgi:hypothetical protein
MIICGCREIRSLCLVDWLANGSFGCCATHTDITNNWFASVSTISPDAHEMFRRQTFVAYYISTNSCLECSRYMFSRPRCIRFNLTLHSSVVQVKCLSSCKTQSVFSEPNRTSSKRYTEMLATKSKKFLRRIRQFKKRYKLQCAWFVM